MHCILAGDAPCVKTGQVMQNSHPSRQVVVLPNFLTRRRLSPQVASGYASRVCLTGGRPKLREIPRKLVAIAALLVLLLPGVSTLAETLSAASLPACCNTIYCPVHHRQMSTLQKDKSNCGALGMPGQNDCSMRACDAPPNPIVGTASFILVTPVSLRGPAVAEAALALTAQFFTSIATIPLTPPPRTLLS